MEIRTSYDEVKRLGLLQLVSRTDWPLVFATNCLGHIWPWIEWGHTRMDHRWHISGESGVLDEIAALYREVRPEGGRFFVDATGAFYKDASGRFSHQFVNFRYGR